MSELRPIDGNGHVPDEAREDVTSSSRESHEILLNPPADPALFPFPEPTPDDQLGLLPGD